MRRATAKLGARNRTALSAAGEVLRAGGVLAFPTETVYGLCVNAADPAAVARLYAAKGRDGKKASALLVADRASAERLTGPFPPLAARLADRYWPGPVTLVVPARNGRTYGFRCPWHPVARQLAAMMPFPLLQTSANPSGKPAALNAPAIAATLPGKVDLVLDSGPAPGGRSSSVVLCHRRHIAIAREAAVPAEEILEAASELLLFACTGNICRSPFAVALMRELLAERLRCAPAELASRGFRLESFGTMATEGREASEYSLETAEEEGLDLKAHRARPFSIALVRRARRVYAMDRSQIDFLLPYFHTRPEDLSLLDPDGKEIRDPYGQRLAVYRKVAAAIREACEARTEELVPEAD